MFSFIVASGSTRRSSFIFRQLSRSSFFAPIFKGQYTIGFDKSRKRLKGITTLPTRLFSHTNTDDDDDDDNYSSSSNNVYDDDAEYMADAVLNDVVRISSFIFS